MYIYQVIVNYDVEAVKENFKTIAMMLKAESKISEPAAHLENITDLHENFIPGSEIHRPRRAHLCTSSEILSGNCFCRSCRDCRRAEATAADSGDNSSISRFIYPPPPTFSDEGQTLAIMDMEKLKKMQQSVRIGELDLCNPSTGSSGQRAIEAPHPEAPSNFNSSIANPVSRVCIDSSVCRSYKSYFTTSRCGKTGRAGTRCRHADKWATVERAHREERSRRCTRARVWTTRSCRRRSRSSMSSLSKLLRR